LASTQTRCPNSSGGTATVNVTSGGVAPFTYAWNDPGNQSTQTAVNLTVGLYTVTVTDDSGCAVSDTISVTSPNPLSVSTNQNNVSCFGLQNGSATANISGGTLPYSIIWDDPGFQTTPTASNLDAGTYIVEVTDDSGCVVLDTVTITQPNQLLLIMGSRDATCSNSNDGIGFVSVSGGTPNYSYAWNDPASQTSDTASNLPVGNFRVVVTDANGCVDSNTISINAPPPIEVLQIQGTNPLCNGGNNGRAVVLAGGGTPGYTYAWNDPNNQTTATANGLTAGTFTVTITDAVGCTLDTSITLIDPPAIQGFVQSVNQPTCFGLANGSFTIGQNNGTPPYRYLLGGNTQSSPIFNGQAAGNYVVVVADVNNCFDSVNVTIPSPIAVQITTQVNDVTCFGLGDGEIIVTANGGTPPYRYRHQLNNYQTSNVLNGLTPRTYHVSVLDSLGCLATDSNLVVTEPPVFTISAVADSLSCKGSGDGRITVSITGGVPPFDSYAITSDGINFQNQSSPVFTGLDAGTYTVTALDGNNCPASVANSFVGEPAFNIFSDTVIGTSCFGEEHQDGAIFVNGIGDNPPFRFSLNGDPFELTNVFRNLGAGPYSIIGQDAKGCRDTFTITVPQPDPIVVIINPPIDTIELGNSIQLSTSVINAVGPLRYQWTPNLGLNCDDCPNPIVSVFESTRYNLTITDLNKPNRAVPCTGEAIVDIIVLPEKPTFIPNMFTPNGDGLNDILLVFGNDIATMKLSIFSRWGEEIFISNTQSQGWDGTYKGEPVPPGVYAYQLSITYLNGEEDFMKGTVTVVR
jgi:gliding motility-associated-like protein